MNVQFWLADEDNTHLGTWWHDEHAQVPRVGDDVWLETEELNLQRFKVVGVQWSFRARCHGSLGTADRSCKAEVHVRPDNGTVERRAISVQRPTGSADRT